MKQRVLSILALLLAVAVLAPTAPAQTPGTDARHRGITPVHWGSLLPEVTHSGLVSASIDALGTIGSSGQIQVQKPAGATVRNAYLAAASTGFSDYTIPDGGVILAGTPVSWQKQTGSGIGSMNHWADVTAIVKPLVDAAVSGTIDLTVQEIVTYDVDGVILAVVFDDPNVTEASTIVFAFGAQAVAGDDFAITLGAPFDDATQNLQMSLGISYGYQTGGIEQFSLVDVNGQRLTSSAGGNDDGQDQNGALLTVGGIGDDPANPADPNAAPTNARSDDELYTLDALIPAGATTVNVHSENPSNDDNIFFAAFLISGTTAIVNEGILLTPPSAVNPVGTSHTVTALVQDDDGNPVAGRDVTFEITSGPSAPATFVAATDATGHAAFTWTSAAEGTDVVLASFVNSNGVTVQSAPVTKTWQPSLVDVTAPVCRIVSRDAAGIVVSVRDVGSGLDEVEILQSTNANVLVPVFVEGTNEEVLVHALKINPAAKSVVALEVEDVAGNTVRCDPVQAGLTADVPEDYVLEQNYPNPFNPTTSIRFSLPEAARARLRVYDVMGRLVADLLDAPMEAGTHAVQWDGRDAAGQMVPSGLYLYRLEAGSFTRTLRMTLAK